MTRRGKSQAQSGSVLDETDADALRAASDRLRGDGMTAREAAAEMVHDNILDWAAGQSDTDGAQAARLRLRIVPRP